MDPTVNAEPQACDLALNGICQVLDSLGTPAIFLSCEGRVVRANALAHQASGVEFQIANGRLTSFDTVLRAPLSKLIDSVANGEATERSISIQRTSNLPIVIHGIRLDDNAAKAFEPARALIVVVDPSLKVLPTEAQLREAFDLSWMEARVTLGVARGEALEDTARDCGISYESARTLIKSVYRKTGTHRQAALVALIYRLSLLRLG